MSCQCKEKKYSLPSSYQIAVTECTLAPRSKFDIEQIQKFNGPYLPQKEGFCLTPTRTLAFDTPYNSYSYNVQYWPMKYAN